MYVYGSQWPTPSDETRPPPLVDGWMDGWMRWMRWMDEMDGWRKKKGTQNEGNPAQTPTPCDWSFR